MRIIMSQLKASLSILSTMLLVSCGLGETIGNAFAAASELKEKFGCETVSVDTKLSSYTDENATRSLHVVFEGCYDSRVAADEEISQKLAMTCLAAYPGELAFDSVYVEIVNDEARAKFGYPVPQEQN